MTMSAETMTPSVAKYDLEIVSRYLKVDVHGAATSDVVAKLSVHSAYVGAEGSDTAARLERPEPVQHAQRVASAAHRRERGPQLLVEGVDPDDPLDQRRLTGAVVADERHDLAGAYFEVDLVERVDGAERFRHPRAREQRRAAAGW